MNFQDAGIKVPALIINHILDPSDMNLTDLDVIYSSIMRSALHPPHPTPDQADILFTFEDIRGISDNDGIKIDKEQPVFFINEHDHPKPLLVVVEGLEATGKTTFVNRASERGYPIIPEHVFNDDIDFEKRNLEDFSSQLHLIVKWVDDAYALLPDNDERVKIIFSDRSPFSTPAFHRYAGFDTQALTWRVIQELQKKYFIVFLLGEATEVEIVGMVDERNDSGEQPSSPGTSSKPDRARAREFYTDLLSPKYKYPRFKLDKRFGPPIHIDDEVGEVYAHASGTWVNHYMLKNGADAIIDHIVRLNTLYQLTGKEGYFDTGNSDDADEED